MTMQPMSKTSQYEMKDSGVEWIGEIPKEWDAKPIKAFFSVITGNGFPIELQGQETGDYPVCKASDISSSNRTVQYTPNWITREIAKEYRFNIIPAGSIIFAKIGEALKKNRRAIVNFDCCVDNNCQALYGHNIDINFSFYLLLCIDMRWFDNAGTIPCVNNQKLKACKIPIPPITEQSAIASYLDEKYAAIDEIIAEAKATIDEYKSWKASVIFEAVTKGLDKNADMKDSGVEWIGRIPKHWRITRTKFCCSKIGSGKTPKGGAEIYADSGIMFLRSQNIYPEGLRLDNVSYITQEIDEEMSSTQVFAVDVLLNITGGSIGRCCIYPQDLPHANVNQHVCIIRVHNNIIMPKLMCYMWMSDVGQKTIDMSQTGANREGMNFEQIGNTIIPIMDKSEQIAIVTYLDEKCAAIDGVIAEKEALIGELESYKKSLIFETVTGKRRVC